LLSELKYTLYKHHAGKKAKGHNTAGRSIDMPQHCNNWWSAPRPRTQIWMGLEVSLEG